ncbi:MAG: phosphate acyltransferase PlsX [Dehalococcoidia bacterium]|nr:phosphate acyltransferase PlsX [Dehalococcoidia bacterium]
MTVLALDAMGGDFAPQSTVAGAVQAAAAGVEVALVGDAEVLGAELNRLGGSPSRVRIVHAPDSLEQSDRVALEVRRRRESSVYVGMEMVKRGEAQALVSLGNTGAAMATALVVLGRLPGVERPALGAVLPTPSGPTLVLDVGANAEARASHLHQFAQMGSAFMRTVHGIPEPRLGLLSIGEESSKGSTLVQETHERLSADPGIVFAGNVEGRDVVRGECQVIVTDGFTGNVVLKTLEGTIAMMFEQLRAVATGSLRAKLGGALLLPSLAGMRSRFDYRRYGAVPLLGVDGGVFIGHGRSDAEAVANALRTASSAVEQGMLGAVRASVEA